ncbi:MAG: hypothetical protein E6H74_01340 [Betaproteobacteria bacterium]|nr:MAG: hypothetical protein E6H74_01340 [Betaproteobacteria bacterium]
MFSKVVYVKNTDYVPRKEPPSWAAGGKVVKVDRVEWIYIPDSATAAAAINAGEVDWWEQMPPDLIPVLAMRSGMMKGTLDEGFASASSARGKGFLSLSVKVLSSMAFHDSVDSAIFCPSASRFDHLSIDAMQSAERTGVPSWNLSPSRSVKV